jgi:hypothetical protein
MHTTTHSLTPHHTTPLPPPPPPLTTTTTTATAATNTHDICFRYGLRRGLVLASALNVLGASIKCLGNLWGHTPHDRLMWQFVGQCLAAAAQPFALGCTTLLAQTWFGEEERRVVQLSCSCRACATDTGTVALLGSCVCVCVCVCACVCHVRSTHAISFQPTHCMFRTPLHANQSLACFHSISHWTFIIQLHTR